MLDAIRPLFARRMVPQPRDAGAAAIRRLRSTGGGGAGRTRGGAGRGARRDQGLVRARANRIGPRTLRGPPAWSASPAAAPAPRGGAAGRWSRPFGTTPRSSSLIVSASEWDVLLLKLDHLVQDGGGLGSSSLRRARRRLRVPPGRRTGLRRLLSRRRASPAVRSAPLCRRLRPRATARRERSPARPRTRPAATAIACAPRRGRPPLGLRSLDPTSRTSRREPPIRVPGGRGLRAGPARPPGSSDRFTSPASSLHGPGARGHPSRSTSARRPRDPLRRPRPRGPARCRVPPASGTPA